ncbi:MAG: hypothetical protein HY649_08370 [Acidobacteria bacterium]|nr:hypothetical protein [Acidobacteriota bacterium]
MPRTETLRSLQCPNCHGSMLLNFEKWAAVIEGIQVMVSDCPILQCPLCDYKTLPEPAMREVDHAVRRTQEKGNNCVSLQCPNESRRFRFSDEIGFLYDARDFLYIPGLWRPNNNGFLTPLFFNRGVLLKYRNASDYVLKFDSNTYGTIRMPAHIISFGINRQDQVLMWLGDVASLPINERHYLRSENIPSSHDVASEFYDGQIDIAFTAPSREQMLFNSRAEFVRKAQLLLGVPVMRLDGECAEILTGFRPPLDEDRRSIPTAIEDLWKVCVECVNRHAFVKHLEAQGIQIVPNLGSIKVLETWLENRIGATAPSIMSPLFVLNDLRNNAAHLLSSGKSTEVLESARTRLGGSNVDLIETYRLLVQHLGSCFQQLAKAAE